MSLGEASSRPPLWARNNARKAVELMDGTGAYVSLLKLKPTPDKIVRKSAGEELFRRYLQRMQSEGRLLITKPGEFIAPCLGTVFVSDGEEIERNLLFSRISYAIKKTGVSMQYDVFMQLPHHALARIFERDLRPPAEVAKAFVSKEFIDIILQLHAVGDLDAIDNAFAIKFLGGFLTGTVRQISAGHEGLETKTLDIRTFLHARDKPVWVQNTSERPFFLFEHSDRRTRNSQIDEIAEAIKGEQKTVVFGAQPAQFKDLPPGV